MDPKEKLTEDPLKEFTHDLKEIHIEQIFPHHPFHLGRVFVLILIFGLVTAVAGTTGYLLGRSEVPQAQNQTGTQINTPVQTGGQ